VSSALYEIRNRKLIFESARVWFHGGKRVKAERERGTELKEKAWFAVEISTLLESRGSRGDEFCKKKLCKKEKIKIKIIVTIFRKRREDKWINVMGPTGVGPLMFHYVALLGSDGGPPQPFFMKYRAS